MFGINLFDPLVGENLKENSAKGIGEAVGGRYNVRYVKDRGNGKYDIYTKDGHRMTAHVGSRCSLFGEDRPFIKYIED